MTFLSRLTRHGSPVGLIDRARSHSRRVLPCLERLEQRTVMTAIASPPVYQNPFMAPNNVSEIHLNAYQTDTFSTLGPASAPSQTVQERLIWPPSQIAGTIAVNSSGQILTIRVGPSPTRLRRPDAAPDRSGHAQSSRGGRPPQQTLGQWHRQLHRGRILLPEQSGPGSLRDR